MSRVLSAVLLPVVMVAVACSSDPSSHDQPKTNYQPMTKPFVAEILSSLTVYRHLCETDHASCDILQREEKRVYENVRSWCHDHADPEACRLQERYDTSRRFDEPSASAGATPQAAGAKAADMETQNRP
jgi:hypothetical protein